MVNFAVINVNVFNFSAKQNEVNNCNDPARKELLQRRLDRYIERERMKVQRLMHDVTLTGERLERMVEVCQELQRILNIFVAPRE